MPGRGSTFWAPGQVKKKEEAMGNDMVTVRAKRPLCSPYFGKRATGRVFECKKEHYEHMKSDLELVNSKELEADGPQVEHKEIHKTEAPASPATGKGKPWSRK